MEILGVPEDGFVAMAREALTSEMQACLEAGVSSADAAAALLAAAGCGQAVCGSRRYLSREALGEGFDARDHVLRLAHPALLL